MSTNRESRGTEPRAERPQDWERRAALTRRRVLGVGGITLLVGCVAEPGKLTSTAQTKPAAQANPAVHTASKTTHPGTGAAGHGTANLASLDKPMFYVDDGPKAIALTIDDGPSAIYTPQVLRILEKYKVKASFSMIGENVTYYPEMAREVADAGHTADRVLQLAVHEVADVGQGVAASVVIDGDELAEPKSAGQGAGLM